MEKFGKFDYESMLSIDRKSRCSIFQNRALLDFHLAEEEVASVLPPSPLFMYVHLHKPLASVYESVYCHFEKFVVKSDHASLFKRGENIEIPCDAPISVIKDLLYPSKSLISCGITVRFGHSKNISSNLISGASSFLLNQFKASLQVRGSDFLHKFNQENKHVITRYQETILDPDEGDLSFLDLIDGSIFRNIVFNKINHVPVKIHSQTAHSMITLTLSAVPFITLEQILEEIGFRTPYIQCFCQGFRVPLGTPLLWLSIHSFGFDGYTHLVLLT